MAGLLLDEIGEAETPDSDCDGKVFLQLAELLQHMNRYNAALPQSELKQQINFRFCNVCWREFEHWASSSGDTDPIRTFCLVASVLIALLMFLDYAIAGLAVMHRLHHFGAVPGQYLASVMYRYYEFNGYTFDIDRRVSSRLHFGSGLHSTRKHTHIVLVWF